MTQKFAWIVLIAALVATGWLLFRVISPFLISLFVAAVLAVLFRPLFDRVNANCGNRPHLAAAISTVLIVVTILFPIGGGLVLAGKQLVEVGRKVTQPAAPNLESTAEELVERISVTDMGRWWDRLTERLDPHQRERLRAASMQAMTRVAAELSGKTLGLVANLFSFAVGSAVMLLALYYFLADGERWVTQLHRLSPLRDEDDEELWKQFETLSRSVVLGTIVAGLAQAILAGIGFAVVGVQQIWLLAALTWLTSLIPFVGASAVWLAVCVGLVIDERYGAAAGLAVYGTIIVSGSDNLIRAYVIGGESQLHPLAVLISVLGTIQFMGLWGIFGGPMIAAFFYSLLTILQKRLHAPVSVTPPRPRRRKKLRENRIQEPHPPQAGPVAPHSDLVSP